MVSNYELAEFLVQQCSDSGKSSIFVIDRFYSSTCAYTIGTKTTGDANAIDIIHSLRPEIFSWPNDLITPQLVILMDIEESTRASRVTARAIDTMGNPWDERLRDNIDMGRRIFRALELIAPTMVLKVDASMAVDSLVNQLTEIVSSRILPNGLPKLVTKERIELLGPRKQVVPLLVKKSVLPLVTIVFSGAHASGKKTLGNLLAASLDVEFHPELGDILRDHNRLAPNGHLYGDGTGVMGIFDTSWDDRVHAAELARDESFEGSRVVETWHVGNLAWALQRGQVPPDSTDKARAPLLARTLAAVEAEVRRGRRVLAVHLDVSPETIMRRRLQFNVSLLPLTNEKEGVSHLHQALGIRTDELLMEEWFQNTSIPVLRLNNNEDGEAAMADIIKKVLAFINQFN